MLIKLKPDFSSGDLDKVVIYKIDEKKTKESKKKIIKNNKKKSTN